MEGDSYKTVPGPGQSSLRERGSRFFGFAYPVSRPEQVKAHVDDLKKRYHDARHVCYAYRLAGGAHRANDDGEPNGSAGLPILGQILSRELYDTLVAVVRYFGGTKLGVPGLIASYKAAAAQALDKAGWVEALRTAGVELEFGFERTSAVMKVVRDMQAGVERSDFDTMCRVAVTVRMGHLEEFCARATQAGAQVGQASQEQVSSEQASQ